MSFQVPTTFSDERVKGLLTCGLESGLYGSFVILRYSYCPPFSHVEFPHINLPFMKGCAVYLKDKHEDTEEIYKLDRDAMAEGLKILAEKYPKLFADFVNENEDVITGDAFVQCCLLGDIVYG